MTAAQAKKLTFAQAVRWHLRRLMDGPPEQFEEWWNGSDFQKYRACIDLALPLKSSREVILIRQMEGVRQIREITREMRQ